MPGQRPETNITFQLHNLLGPQAIADLLWCHRLNSMTLMSWLPVLENHRIYKIKLE